MGSSRFTQIGLNPVYSLLTRLTNLSSALWLENPAAERERSGVAIAIGFPMPHQSFVATAPMSDTAVEVLTVCGDFAGKGAIPRPAFIFDMEGAPQVTCHAQFGRRRGLEIRVTNDRFLAGDPRIRIDIVI